MIMYNFIFLIILFIIILPIFVYLKIKDLGLDKSKSIFAIITFFKIVPRVHFKIFKELKDENIKRAIRILISPIIELPRIITLYSYSIIEAEAKYKAIEELIPEFNNQQINVLEEILKKEGVKLKIKNKKIKKITVSTNKNNKRDKICTKKRNKQIWNVLLNYQVDSTVKSEMLKQRYV